MYLEVQKSAQTNKISNILLIAHKLGIDIDVEGDYSESLSIEIKKIKNNNFFILISTNIS